MKRRRNRVSKPSLFEALIRGRLDLDFDDKPCSKKRVRKESESK